VCEGERSSADSGAVKGKAVKSNGEEAWWENYELLLLFKSLNGHAHILKSEPLGLWVKEQRQSFQHGRLVRGREKLLRDAGFEFDGAYAASYRESSVQKSLCHMHSQVRVLVLILRLRLARESRP
jgi:hypothetical protein